MYSYPQAVDSDAQVDEQILGEIALTAEGHEEIPEAPPHSSTNYAALT